jgi:integrase
VRTLSTVLSEAVEDEKLQANPALRPGRLRRQLRDAQAPKRKAIDPYSRGEVEQLLTAAAQFPDWSTFLLVAVRTGLRLGELRALQWGDLDWRGRFVQVERNFVEGTHTVPKSGRGRRVDLSLQTCAALRLWRRRQAALWLSREKSRPALVFPSEAATPLDDSRIRKALRDIVEAAEVRERKSIVHVLRHTYATLLLQQGEPLTYVRDQLGHASIQITVDVYGHLLPSGNRSAVDRLDSEDDAFLRNPRATTRSGKVLEMPSNVLIRNGEPPRNRTENPQIKRRMRRSESPKDLKKTAKPGGNA